MSQSLKGARRALFATCRTLYADELSPDDSPTLVTYGKPGTYQPDQIVAVMDTRRPITQPTMGSSRSRRTEAQIDVVFSVFVPGAPDDDTSTWPALDAADKCEDLIAILETHLRTSPNETLDDTCREALVSNVQGPNVTPIANKAGAFAGYTADALVTVTLRLDY